jgi:chromate transporter
LIGWQVSGFWGAVVATLAIYIPSSIVVYAASDLWHKHADSPWRLAIERGLAPVALGLIFAGIVAVLRAAHILDANTVDLLGLATVLGSAALLYFTKISPYLLISLVAVLYGSLQYAGVV